MKVSEAFGKAYKAYFASFGRTMAFLAVELSLSLICASPLLFLSSPRLKALALLALPLFVFLLLPCRINAAGAMQDALEGESVYSLRLIDMEGYRGKLWCGLKRVFFVMLWILPLAAFIFAVRYYYAGSVSWIDALEVVIDHLGGGSLTRGIVITAAAGAAALLIMLAGFAFHSGARHAYVRGIRPLRHHGRVILSWLAAGLTLIPLFAAIIIAAFMIPAMIREAGGFFALLRYKDPLGLASVRRAAVCLGIGALLAVPLLPLRSLITAACVRGTELK